MTDRLVIGILCLWLCFYVSTHLGDENLQIITCDVGQGDAILIQHKRWQLLIDGGRDEKVLTCLDEYLPFLDKTLEVMLVTHPDADHIGGLPTVISSYEVKQVVTNGQTKKTDDFRRLEEAVQRKVACGTARLLGEKGVKILTPQTNTFFEVKILFPLVGTNPKLQETRSESETILSDVKTTILQDTGNYNNGSIVLLLQYGTIKLLLTGDLEREGEQALLEEKLIVDVDVLKVGHHGAKTSTSTEFLEVSRPEIALISVGKNNNYGHPSPQVLAQLVKNGTTLFRTDLEGTILLVTDGNDIWRSTPKFHVKELLRH